MMLPTCHVKYDTMTVRKVNREMLNNVHRKQKLCLLRSGNVIWSYDLWVWYIHWTTNLFHFAADVRCLYVTLQTKTVTTHASCCYCAYVVSAAKTDTIHYTSHDVILTIVLLYW